MPYDPYRALYIHIPFCASKCAYCDFTSHALSIESPEIDDAIEDLCLHIRHAAKEEKLGHIETVYIGGGTPSYVGISRLSMLLYTLSLSLHLTSEVECTMEANPESLTERMVHDIWALGVNRLSIGVQSFDDGVLAALGRAHNAEDARCAIRAAQTRFENVSIDLMCGIPGQSNQSFQADVHEAVRLGVKHISIYPLTVEPHTLLEKKILRGEQEGPDDDREAEHMEIAEQILTARGFVRYEVANYARPGYECRHNSAYWSGVPYLGLGLSAVTMTQNDSRRMRMQDGRIVDDLNVYQMQAEDLMLAMRMACGISDGVLAQASKLLPQAAEVFSALEEMGLLVHSEGRWKPTHRGWLCGNELYGRLYDLAP